ncbi:tRNA 2'-phosphotransferase 1-like isoform X2 [Carassius auratus]|nr:tRNA 2'-phosphotransferase 1-like isoform X2 [Carassius auratus]
MGLQMNSDGFVFVDELLTHKQFHSFSLEDVERVVATNDKQRFKLCHHPEDGRLQIRANQGHSVQVTDLELRAVALDDPDYPREAVHGSYMKHWPSLRSHGRVISENGVLLTPGDAAGMLLPCYFSRAQRLKPSPCELELH